MSKSLGFLKKSWGFSFFLVLMSVGFVQVVLRALRGVSSHDYDIFRASALLLLGGQSPYGISYPAGEYLYSPAAGILYYLPISLLPYSISLVVIYFFLFLFFVGVSKKFYSDQKLLSQFGLNVFFVLIAFEALGSLQNAKIELFIAGTYLWLVLEAQTACFSSCLTRFLAALSQFKLQPLSSVGLLLTALNKVTFKKFSYNFLLTFVILFFLPGFYFGFEQVWSLHAEWLNKSSHFIRETFETRSHLWVFFKNILNLNFSYSLTQQITLLWAAVFFLYCLYKRFFCQEAERDRVLRALALGGVFSLIFSPAAQSSAFVMLAPLYLAYLKFGFSSGSELFKTTFQKQLWILGLVLSFVFVSLLYSDLAPSFMRSYARENALKSLGASILLGCYLYFDIKNVSRRGSSCSQ